MTRPRLDSRVFDVGNVIMEDSAMTAEITIERTDRDGEPMTILSADALGSLAAVYVRSDTVEICLSDWYGRQLPDNALAGIDAIIALLVAAKVEIAKVQQA